VARTTAGAVAGAPVPTQLPSTASLVTPPVQVQTGATVPAFDPAANIRSTPLVGIVTAVVSVWPGGSPPFTMSFRDKLLDGVGCVVVTT
jgi:hypothetical protein